MTSTCCTVSVPGALSAWSTFALSGMRLPPRTPSSDGDHDGRCAVCDPARERVRGEAAEHHGVDRADAGAGEHRHRSLGNHRQVDRDPVALLDAERAQRVRQPADPVVELSIGHPLALVRVVAFPDDRRLVAVRGEVSIEAVGRDVQLPVLEPADVEVADIEAHVLHARVGTYPVHAPSHARPEPLRVADGLVVERPVLFVGDAGPRGEIRRHLVELGHGRLPVFRSSSPLSPAPRVSLPRGPPVPLRPPRRVRGTAGLSRRSAARRGSGCGTRSGPRPGRSAAQS